MASSNNSSDTKAKYAPKYTVIFEDTQFRTALENMRYAQCTQNDIDFLKTCIAGKNAGKPNIAKKRFRNVSIITELNSQKDQLNKLGSMRFATETGQKLTDFCSDDELGEDIDLW